MKDRDDSSRQHSSSAGDPAFAKHGYEIETMIAAPSSSRGDGEVTEFRLVDRRNANRKARAFRYRVTNCRHMEQMLNWRWIRHPNVLRLVEYFIDAERRYVYCVCEILPKEDVVSRRLGASSKNVKSRSVDGSSGAGGGHQREELCRRWTRECLTALAHAHHLHLYHNNFNWNNVYLDGHDNAKLTDFRLLRYVPPSKLVYQPCQVDMQFLSPEALRDGRMTAAELNKSELWSVGASLLKVLLNLNMAGATLDVEPSITDTNERQLRSHIGKNHSKLSSVLKGSSDELLSYECRQFLEAILCPSHVADRPTVEQALLHPWLQSGDRPVDVERLIENRYGTGTAQHEYVIVVPIVTPSESKVVEQSRTTISSEESISEETIDSEVSTLTVVDVEEEITPPVAVPTATDVSSLSSEYVSTAAFISDVSPPPTRGFANAAVQTDEIPLLSSRTSLTDDGQMLCPVETTIRTVYTETIVTREDCHADDQQQQYTSVGEPQFVTTPVDDVDQLSRSIESPTPSEGYESSVSLAPPSLPPKTPTPQPSMPPSIPTPPPLPPTPSPEPSPPPQSLPTPLPPTPSSLSSDLVAPVATLTPPSSSTEAEYFTAEETGLLDVHETVLEVDDRPPSSTPTEYSIGSGRSEEKMAIMPKVESESRKSFSEISTQTDFEEKIIEPIEYKVPPRIMDVAEEKSVSVRSRVTPRSSVGSAAQKKKSKVRPPSPWRFIVEEEEETADDYESSVSLAPSSLPPKTPTPQPSMPPSIPMPPPPPPLPPTPSPEPSPPPQSLPTPLPPTPSPLPSLPPIPPPSPPPPPSLPKPLTPIPSSTSPSPRPSLESHVSAHGEPDSKEAQMPVIAVSCGGTNRFLRPRLEMRTTVQSVVDTENMPQSMADFDFVLVSENAYKIPPIPALMTDLKCPPGTSPIVLVGRQHTHVEVFDPCEERLRSARCQAMVEDVCE